MVMITPEQNHKVLSNLWQDKDGITSETRFAKLSSRNIRLSLTNLYVIINKVYADRRIDL